MLEEGAVAGVKCFGAGGFDQGSHPCDCGVDGVKGEGFVQGLLAAGR